jgi:hypothetical protein
MEFEIFKDSGHKGTRTPNFFLVREAVYQLTYMPEFSNFLQLFCCLRRANGELS